jgi:large-conductance mechanosensitive channel
MLQVNIPENPSIIYVSIVLFLIGLFLFISGLNILKVEKVTVTRGTKTWVIGLILMVFSIFIGVYRLNNVTQDKANNNQNPNKKPLPCQIALLHPKIDDVINASATTVEGNSINCPKEKTYSLILQDNDGDYYNQGNISFTTNGRWLSAVQFGPRWSGKKAIIKIVGHTGNIDWNNVSNTLPHEVEIYDQVGISIK